MDKRYQIFISSTYLDLKEERQEVLLAVLEQKCIPAGMELFIATFKNLWDVITGIIDESDFYILIIGRKYGTPAENNISYTEKEFNYAKDKEIPIMIFIMDYSNFNDFEKEKTNDKGLMSFIKKLEKSNEKGVIKYPENKYQLKSYVTTAINEHKNDKTLNRPGWVRGDCFTNQKTIDDNDILELLEETFTIQGIYLPIGTLVLPKSVNPHSVDTNWQWLFEKILSLFSIGCNHNEAKNYLNQVISDTFFPKILSVFRTGDFRISEESLVEILSKFIGLKIIEVTYKNIDKLDIPFYKASDEGNRLLKKLDSINKKIEKERIKLTSENTELMKKVDELEKEILTLKSNQEKDIDYNEILKKTFEIEYTDPFQLNNKSSIYRTSVSFSWLCNKILPHIRGEIEYNALLRNFGIDFKLEVIPRIKPEEKHIKFGILNEAQVLSTLESLDLIKIMRKSVNNQSYRYCYLTDKGEELLKKIEMNIIT